ncbi:hypothetical protein H2248_002187 [Termitomyces sp. 'cryptogamus']|nr:hypothetical protein H2248_002187 [Termitomyces sp. 'cryptogamus']
MLYSQLFRYIYPLATAHRTTLIHGLQNCPNPACLCTTNNARTLESCLDCVVGIDPSTEVVMSAQSILSAFSGSCQGTSVSSLSLSIGSSATAPVTSSILSSLPSRTSLNSDSTLALPTSTPTTPATSSSHVSQLTVISMSPSSTTTATSTSSSGGSVSPNSASSLSIAWNGFLGAGVGVVVVRNSIHQIIESNVASFDRVWLLNLSKTIVRSRNSCSPVLDVRIPNTEVLKPEDDFTRKKFTERYKRGTAFAESTSPIIEQKQKQHHSSTCVLRILQISPSHVSRLMTSLNFAVHRLFITHHQ